MTLEIRPYREEDEDAFNRVLSIVFGNYRADPPPRDSALRILPEWSLCAYEDGELATTYAAYPFSIRLNGARTTAAGVTAVGTLPWHRRRGQLRKIMETDFKRRYEEQMQPLAILLASMAAIYQRFGYGVSSSRYRYTIDPKFINFAPSLPATPAPGRWREASRDELPLLQTMYREFSGPRNGYLHRGNVIWEMQVLGLRQDQENPGGNSLVSVYEEDGEPRGYVAYAAKFYERFDGDNAGPGQRLFVRDYAWLTPSAYRAMWELLKTFDLVNRVHVFAAPGDDPAFHTMLDPRELNATRGDWLLGRIIDIERSLPARPYGEGRVVFNVVDAMCPWNADTWALEAGAEGSTVTRSKESPQLSLDVSTLAQLLFGEISPTLAVRYGRAEAAPNANLALWDNMWRTAYAPFCPDGF